MLTRRVALPLAALTALAGMPVLASAVPAGASSAVGKPAPDSRGKPGDPRGPQKKNEKQDEQKPNNCPTKLWTVPLELKGLACVLLLPKPEQPGDASGGDGGGGGGVGGLL